MTEVSPAIAPSDTTKVSHLMPGIWATASEMGFATFSCVTPDNQLSLVP